MLESTKHQPSQTSSVDVGWIITDPGICSSTESTWIDKASSPCLHAHCPCNLEQDYGFIAKPFSSLVRMHTKHWQWNVNILECLVSKQPRKTSKTTGSCTAQCKMMLFCAQTVVKRVTQYCPSPSLKRSRSSWTYGDFLVRYFHGAFWSHYESC